MGVCARDTRSGETVAHRADERFSMASTFKWLLAAAVLAEVDRGALALDARVPFTEADLLPYAPATRARLADGAMSVEDLARVAVTVSDNTAANLLLRRIDGPAGLTRFVRALGDDLTRLDRDEPSLNENRPGDPRDTTSPRAMVGLLQRILLGNALSAPGRARITAWMRGCETGRDRIAAGLPRDWALAHKTGSGERGAINDLGVATAPDGSSIALAIYLSEGTVPTAQLAAAHAAITRAVVRALRPHG